MNKQKQWKNQAPYIPLLKKQVLNGLKWSDIFYYPHCQNNQ